MESKSPIRWKHYAWCSISLFIVLGILGIRDSRQPNTHDPDHPSPFTISPCFGWSSPNLIRLNSSRFKQEQDSHTQTNDGNVTALAAISNTNLTRFLLLPSPSSSSSSSLSSASSSSTISSLSTSTSTSTSTITSTSNTLILYTTHPHNGDDNDNDWSSTTLTLSSWNSYRAITNAMFSKDGSVLLLFYNDDTFHLLIANIDININPNEDEDDTHWVVPTYHPPNGQHNQVVDGESNRLSFRKHSDSPLDSVAISGDGTRLVVIGTANTDIDNDNIDIDIDIDEDEDEDSSVVTIYDIVRQGDEYTVLINTVLSQPDNDTPNNHYDDDDEDLVMQHQFGSIAISNSGSRLVIESRIIHPPATSSCSTVLSRIRVYDWIGPMYNHEHEEEDDDTVPNHHYGNDQWILQTNTNINNDNINDKDTTNLFDKCYARRIELSQEGNRMILGRMSLKYSFFFPMTKDIHIYHHDDDGDAGTQWNQLGQSLLGEWLSISDVGNMIAIRQSNFSIKMMQYQPTSNIWIQVGRLLSFHDSSIRSRSSPSPNPNSSSLVIVSSTGNRIMRLFKDQIMIQDLMEGIRCHDSIIDNWAVYWYDFWRGK